MFLAITPITQSKAMNGDPVKVDLIRLAAIESSINPTAISKTGDYGLLQINPSALEGYNNAFNSSLTPEDLLSPEINIQVGDWYINKRIPQLLKAEGLPDNVANRLAAYNQGARGLATNGFNDLAQKRLNEYNSVEYMPHSNHILLDRNGTKEKLSIHPSLGYSPEMMGPNILPNFQKGGSPSHRDSVDLYNYYLLQKEVEGFVGDMEKRTKPFNTWFNPFDKVRRQSVESANKGPRDDFFPSGKLTAAEILRRNNILREYADSLILNNPNLVYEQDISSPDIYGKNIMPSGSYMSEIAQNYTWEKPKGYDDTTARERIRKIVYKADADKKEKEAIRQREADMWNKFGQIMKNHNWSESKRIDTLNPQLNFERELGNPQFTQTILPRPGVSGFNTRSQIMYEYDPNTKQWGRPVGIKGYKKQLGGLINLTGYTPGTSTFNNPINIIPSNHITMKNTPFSVLGIPDRGNPRVMKPGSEHVFPGAQSVKEVPLAQYGGFFDYLNFVTNSIAGGLSGTRPLTPFGSNAQANAVLQDGINVGRGFLENNMNVRDQRVDALKDKFQGATEYPGYQNENMPFGEFHYYGDAHGSGAQNYADASVSAQQQYNNIQKGFYDNMAGAGAANAFGVLFSLNQQNQKNALSRAKDPLYEVNMKNYTTGPTIVKKGGKLKYQTGGEVQPPIPVQTEKGETVLLPDGKLVNVNAKKMHKNMDGKEVTDILPAGSFVFSNDKDMKISKDKAKKIELGYDNVHYDENKIGTPPDMKTLADFFPKGKKDMTFAELSKEIRNKYKASDRKFDAFAAKTKQINMQNRAPLLEALKMLNVDKMPKSAREEQGLPKMQFGGNLFSNKFLQETNKAITGIDNLDLIEKRDKALRNDGLYPSVLFSQNPMKGITSNNSFMKGQYGLAIGMGLLGGLNQIMGARSANAAYDQRMLELEDLNQELSNRINLGTGIQALGTLGQDTRYTRLNTDPIRGELLSGYRGAEQAITSGRDLTNNQINAGSRTLLRGLSDAGFDPSDIAANFAVSRAQANEALFQNNARSAQNLANLRLQQSQGLQNLAMTDQSELKNEANYVRGANNQLIRNLADIGTQQQNSLASLAQFSDAQRAMAMQDKATRMANVTNNTMQLLGGASSIASNTFNLNRLTTPPAALAARASAPIMPASTIAPPVGSGVIGTSTGIRPLIPRMTPILDSRFAPPIG